MTERIQAILQRVEHLKDPSNTRQVGLPPLLLVDVPWLAAQLETAQDAAPADRAGTARLPDLRRVR